MENKLEDTYKITEIYFTHIKPIKGLIGFVSLVINENLFFGGIAVYTKLDKKGYRISYPFRKTSNTTFNYYHPITKDLSAYFENIITKEVERQMILVARDFIA